MAKALIKRDWTTRKRTAGDDPRTRATPTSRLDRRQLPRDPAPTETGLSRLASNLARHWGQIALCLGVFLLVLSHAAGLIDLSHLGNQLSLQGERVLPDYTTTGRPSGAALLSSPAFLVLTGLGLTLSLLLPLLSPVKASLLALVAMLPVLQVGLFASEPVAIPMQYLLLTILVLFVVNVITTYFAETRQRQKLLQAFGHYVPPELVRSITQDPERLALHGEARKLTVMFCDVRHFSAISESLDPRQLAALLNALFTPLTSILYKHRGTIDKYMGDAVMAFWGAPIADDNHARHALLAAFEIQDMLAKLAPAFNKRGWPPISMGIGLNSGIMNVGIMGSRYRMTYTVVGDAVNLAARLQDLTRVYNTDIIVGEGTRNAFPSAFYRELGLVQVKGKDTPARIFEPCNPAADPDSTIVRDMHRHNEALRRYYAREWDQSESLFQTLRKAHPEDTLYPLYLERIAEYRKTPPPADWKGEVRYTIH